MSRKVWGDDEVEMADSAPFTEKRGRLKILDNGTPNMRRYRGTFGVAEACAANSRRMAEGSLTKDEELAFGLRAPPAWNEFGSNYAASCLEKFGAGGDAGIHDHLR